MTKAPSSFVMVPREVMERMRNRIHALGVVHADPRHFMANEKIYLPEIDAVLASAPVQGEVVSWQARHRMYSGWTSWFDVPNIVSYRKLSEQEIRRGEIELRPLYTHPAQPVAAREALEERIFERFSDCSTIDFYNVRRDGIRNLAMLAAQAALTVIPVAGDQKKSTAEGGHQTEQDAQCTKSAGGDRYSNLLATLLRWRDRSDANFIELTRGDIITLLNCICDDQSYADLRESGGISHAESKALPAVAWLVQWSDVNGNSGSDAYTDEKDATRAASNIEAYFAVKATARVTPLYARGSRS